jgi:hypothetical protein
MIRSQHLAYAVYDISVQPVNGSSDDDDRSDADYYSYESEKRAELVSENGLKSELEGVNVEGVDISHKIEPLRLIDDIAITTNLC